VTDAHPLASLTAAEMSTAVATVRATGRLGESARFEVATLVEPAKSDLAAGTSRRVARVVVVPGAGAGVCEVLVDLTRSTVTSWTERPDARPTLLFLESFNAILAVRADARWQAAMRLRGLTDFEQVQIDPWPTGSFGIAHEEGRRVARCLSYLRDKPDANGYARPIEGVLVSVDLATSEVLEVVDHGVVPLPPDAGSYYPEDNGPLREDLRPLEISQPDGSSVTVDGNEIRWQRWSLRVSLHPFEGLVLHQVGYDDRGRLRPVLHRASISEMVVPYGDPGPMHSWKNAFDVGEWGLGRMANSLTLGCDCLGEITYLDAPMLSEMGDPYDITNAICIHEEDYGILWKHTDMNSGRTEVRRSRRLVVSSISTVGNYEYGFYWYLYLDGTIQLEVKLTGVMSTQAMPPGATSPFASIVAPGLSAPVHQHLFCARLDLDVDGTTNEVYEVDVEPAPSGAGNEAGNAFAPRATRLDTEHAARRCVDASRSRGWKVVNPGSLNALGQPVAYKLVPGATPTLLAGPDASVRRRAGFAAYNLWVTPHCDDERRPAGDYPNQHPGGEGLPAWTAGDRSLVDTDVVLWHTFGVTHVPRPEDWPVMPVEYCGFSLVPAGFFDRNPALDVPPPPSHCH
jgi:primary-amine oxidase